jgi:hypothetical protein
MNILTNAQTAAEELLTPHEVVEKMVMEDASPARAWREHLGLSMETIANRLGLGVADYAMQEAREDLPAATLAHIAAALGIDAELLKV